MTIKLSLFVSQGREYLISEKTSFKPIDMARNENSSNHSFLFLLFSKTFEYQSYQLHLCVFDENKFYLKTVWCNILLVFFFSSLYAVIFSSLNRLDCSVLFSILSIVYSWIFWKVKLVVFLLFNFFPLKDNSSSGVIALLNFFQVMTKVHSKFIQLWRSHLFYFCYFAMENLTSSPFRGTICPYHEVQVVYWQL